MYLWQRLAGATWWRANEERVRAGGGAQLATIERPNRKRLIVQISCRSRAAANALQGRFGGSVVKLPRDWLRQFQRVQRTKPLRIGKRLVIANVGKTAPATLRVDDAGRASVSRHKSPAKLSRHQGRSHIVIPVGAAFGTGEHITTAMPLRMLEQLTRRWRMGWTMVDLGTGSGILALAAKQLGAGRVVAIDIDPVAISTAKTNARLNRVNGVSFQTADVRKWRIPTDVKLVTANLFSELLIDLLPKLRRIPWLILSGIRRNQEADVQNALSRNRIEVVTTRRRGKWIAALAKAADDRRFG